MEKLIIKTDLEYIKGHYNELIREIAHCQDKQVLMLLELEMKHTRGLLNRTIKTMKEMEKL